MDLTPSNKSRKALLFGLWYLVGCAGFALTFVLDVEITRTVFWLVVDASWYWLLPSALHSEYTPLGHPSGYVISIMVCSAIIASSFRLAWAVALAIGRLIASWRVFQGCFPPHR